MSIAAFALDGAPRVLPYPPGVHALDVAGEGLNPGKGVGVGEPIPLAGLAPLPSAFNGTALLAAVGLSTLPGHRRMAS